MSSLAARKSNICLLNSIKWGKIIVFNSYLYHYGIIRFVFYPEAIVRNCSLKKLLFKFRKIHKKTLRVFFWIHFVSAACNIFEIEASAKVFLCEFLRNFKNYFFWLTASGGCFFQSQDAKHKNTLRQLHEMGSLFDGKYNQWDNRFLPITEEYLEPSWKCMMFD